VYWAQEKGRGGRTRFRRGKKEVEEGEKAEGGRGGNRVTGKGDKSPAWSSQNLGSTSF